EGGRRARQIAQGDQRQDLTGGCALEHGSDLAPPDADAHQPRLRLIGVVDVAALVEEGIEERGATVVAHLQLDAWFEAVDRLEHLRQRLWRLETTHVDDGGRRGGRRTTLAVEGY